MEGLGFISCYKSGWVTTTQAPSEMGRLAQLLKAAGLSAPVQIAPPSGPQPGSPAEAEELASLD